MRPTGQGEEDQASRVHEGLKISALSVGHTATLLPSGEVLIVGGNDSASSLAGVDKRRNSGGPVGSDVPVAGS